MNLRNAHILCLQTSVHNQSICKKSINASIFSGPLGRFSQLENSCSQVAFDSVYICATTLLSTGPSNKPAGIHIYSPTFILLGTGLPQILQKSDLNPLSLVNELILSLPLIQIISSIPVIIEALEAAPVAFLQREQWH